MATTQTDRNNATPSSIQNDGASGLYSSTAFKGPVRVRVSTNVTLSGEQTLDGVACVAGDRVLLTGQTDQTTNGIYVVSTGEWQRAADFNRNDDVVKGTAVRVTEGTYDGIWVLTTANPVTFDTSNLTFEQSDVGPPGPQGDQGIQGIQGDQGIQGNPGTDGKFSGTEVIETGASRTLGVADVGKTFIANRATAITFNLDPAATLGATWMVIVKNVGAGDLTIDPSGAETIDGDASLTLTTDQSAVIASNGTDIRSHFVSGGGGMFKGNNGTVGARAGDIFRVNAQTLTADTTIAATENASATGPLAVNTGVTLTVASGGTLAIV